MTVGYHDIKIGMEFSELAPKKTPRRVRVFKVSTYSSDCTIVAGRGAGNNLRVFNKQLSNTKMWKQES